MPDLANRLHDEIDYEEELRERARDKVAEVKAEFVKLVDDVGDLGEAMATAAVLLEDKLTDLTTEAVQKGVELTLKRGT